MNVKNFYVTVEIFSKTLLRSANNKYLTLNVVHPVCRALICVCMSVSVENVTRVRVI